MKDTMKRMKFLPLVLVLGVMLFSCEKDSTKEWEYKYGYTIQDIIGQYVFSGVQDAFSGLTESEFIHLCQDATVNITSGGTLRFDINCPRNSYNRTFTGTLPSDEDRFLIHMAASQSANSDDVTAYVYTNKQGKIRLHGYARKAAYSPADDVYYKVNYYFDVIKR